MALYAANLDSLDLEVDIIDITKDKEEPAHEVETNVLLQTSSEEEIELRIKLSRRIILSNKIKIIGENGFVELSTDLSDVVRLGTETHSTVIHASHKYDTLMDCFAVQFKGMFSSDVDEKFTANKFINLTKIMEKIAHGK
jgi:Zn-dependent M32 family carboxypeptidase